MSEIKIEKQHALGEAEAKKRVVEMEAKLKEKYGVTLAWRGNEADLKGSGVSGVLRVSASAVAVDVKLGLMLRPLAGKIREGLERQVDKALV